MLLFIVMKCQAHAGMSQDLVKLCLNLIFTLYWREWKSVAAWNEGACLKKKKKSNFCFRNYTNVIVCRSKMCKTTTLVFSEKQDKVDFSLMDTVLFTGLQLHKKV